MKLYVNITFKILGDSQFKYLQKNNQSCAMLLAN